MSRSRNFSKVPFHARDVKVKHIAVLALGLFLLAFLYRILQSDSPVQGEDHPQRQHEEKEQSAKLTADPSRGTIYASIDVPIDAVHRGDRNIFFVEASCAFAERNVELSARQACSVESAARSNPTHKVYYLHTCPLDVTRLRDGGAHVRELFRYPNVFFSRLNATELFQRSPLQEWWEAGYVRDSEYPTAHAQDLLKYLVLALFGGTCLDLDVVLLRALPDQKNFLAAESQWAVSTSAMNLGVDKVGREFSLHLLEEVRDAYKAEGYSSNGPELVTRVMQRVCNVTEVSAMTAEGCAGVTVLAAEVFNPLYWASSQTLFKHNEVGTTFLRGLFSADSRTLAVKAWNVINEGIPVHVGSLQPYGVVAHQSCPRVYSTCGQIF